MFSRELFNGHSLDALSNLRSIQFVSAPCSSGKTRAAIQYARNNLFERNFVFVAPTYELIDQVKREFEALGITPIVITHRTLPGQVKWSLLDAILNLPSSGTVLICTWSAYGDLPYMPKGKSLSIFIDEIPQIDNFYSLRLPKNLSRLTELIDVLWSTECRGIARVIPKDPAELSKLLRGIRDDCEDVLFDFQYDLISPNRDMFVDVESWRRIAIDKQITKDNAANKIFFLSMLNANPFNNATVLGANFEDTMLKLWLERHHRLSLTPHAEIKSQLRQPPSVGSKLKIRYFGEGDRIASKYLFNLDAADGKVIDLIDREAVRIMEDRPFLWVANNDRKSSVLSECRLGYRIPVKSHGMNSYQDYDAIYFSAALNREPAHYSMLERLGFSRDFVNHATASETVYQAVMRTSLRDVSSDREVLAIVCGRVSAKRLQELTLAPEPEKIPMKCLEKAPPLTQQQRDQKHVAKKGLEKFISMETLQKSFSSKETRSENEEIDEAEILSCQSGEQTPSVFVTLHPSRFTDEEAQHSFVRTSLSDLRREWKRQARALQLSKHDRMMFTPVEFRRANNSKGWRKLENFKQASLLGLDFDGGVLSKDDFVRLYRTEAAYGQKLCFLMYNSYRRSERDPNRFHVLVFLRRPAESVDQLRCVHEVIVDRLEASGITAKDAKLESFNAVRPLYMPATNPAHKEMAFFESYGLSTKEVSHTIDPVSLHETQIPSVRRTYAKTEAHEATRERIDDILKPLRGLSSGRHKLIFEAVRKLMALGLGASDTKAELIAVVGTEKKVLKKINDAIKSVRSSSRWTPTVTSGSVSHPPRA